MGGAHRICTHNKQPRDKDCADNIIMEGTGVWVKCSNAAIKDRVKTEHQASSVSQDTKKEQCSPARIPNTPQHSWMSMASKNMKELLQPGITANMTKLKKAGAMAGVLSMKLQTGPRHRARGS